MGRHDRWAGTKVRLRPKVGRQKRRADIQGRQTPRVSRHSCIRTSKPVYSEVLWWWKEGVGEGLWQRSPGHSLISDGLERHHRAPARHVRRFVAAGRVCPGSLCGGGAGPLRSMPRRRRLISRVEHATSHSALPFKGSLFRFSRYSLLSSARFSRAGCGSATQFCLSGWGLYLGRGGLPSKQSRTAASSTPV